MRICYSFLPLVFIMSLIACKQDTAVTSRETPQLREEDKPIDLKETPMQDFLFLLGDWEGEFEFVIKMSDLSTQILPAECTIVQDQHKIKMNYKYTAEGREVPDKQEVFHDISRGIFFGGNYNGIEKVERNGENMHILLTRTGTENRKPSDIETTIDYDGKQVKIVKMVKPEGKSEFSFRNSYTLNKKSS